MRTLPVLQPLLRYDALLWEGKGMYDDDDDRDITKPVRIPDLASAGRAKASRDYDRGVLDSVNAKRAYYRKNATPAQRRKLDKDLGVRRKGRR